MSFFKKGDQSEFKEDIIRNQEQKEPYGNSLRRLWLCFWYIVDSAVNMYFLALSWWMLTDSCTQRSVTNGVSIFALCMRMHKDSYLQSNVANMVFCYFVPIFISASLVSNLHLLIGLLRRDHALLRSWLSFAKLRIVVYTFITISLSGTAMMIDRDFDSYAEALVNEKKIAKEDADKMLSYSGIASFSFDTNKVTVIAVMMALYTLQFLAIRIETHKFLQKVRNHFQSTIIIA